MSHLIGKIKALYPGTDATFKVCYNAGGISVVFTFEDKNVVDAIKREGYETFEYNNTPPLTFQV